ncbi:hypothetical protein BX616_003024, partial [Lobosporangium transversale]
MAQNDLIDLIQQDRSALADTTKGFAQDTKENQAKRANDAANQVAMFLQGEDMVIYPSIKKNMREGAALVQESLKRLRPIIQDLARLERMSVEDSAFQSTFDDTFNRFFEHWDHEDQTLRLLRDAMCEAEYNLLGPRWLAVRLFAPSR